MVCSTVPPIVQVSSKVFPGHPTNALIICVNPTIAKGCGLLFSIRTVVCVCVCGQYMCVCVCGCTNAVDACATIKLANPVLETQLGKVCYYSITHSSASSQGSHDSPALDRLPALPLQVWLTGLESDGPPTTSS